jgi:hypothetical protein
MKRGVNWIHLAQKLDGSVALISTVMNQWVPYKVRNLSASSECICPQEDFYKLKYGHQNVKLKVEAPDKLIDRSAQEQFLEKKR